MLDAKNPEPVTSARAISGKLKTTGLRLESLVAKAIDLLTPVLKTSEACEPAPVSPLNPEYMNLPPLFDDYYSALNIMHVQLDILNDVLERVDI